MAHQNNQPGPDSPADLSLGLIGLGAVGSALARGLVASGARVLGWSRGGARREIEGEPGFVRVGDLTQLALGVPDLGAVIFAVSDAALEEVVERFAREWERAFLRGVPEGNSTAPVALHTAGVLGPEVLGPLSRRGWAVAQMHPLASVRAGGPLAAGAWWGIAGDAAATAVAARLAEVWGGRVLELEPGTSPRYHLAANLVAGGAVALVDLGLEALEGAADPVAARQALAALLVSSARNLVAAPPAEALTGPQARGDRAVIEAHLAALADLDPELARVYRLLARRMLRLARGGQRSQDAAVADERSRISDELERLLGGA